MQKEASAAQQPATLDLLCMGPQHVGHMAGQHRAGIPPAAMHWTRKGAVLCQETRESRKETNNPRAARMWERVARPSNPPEADCFDRKIGEPDSVRGAKAQDPDLRRALSLLRLPDGLEAVHADCTGGNTVWAKGFWRE